MALLPPVWHLRSDFVEVTQWHKHRGAVKVKVGRRTKGWTPISQISRHSVHALVTAEDSQFFAHPGIDLEQIILAFQNNLRKKRYAFGASTISQQVVKMVFLTREKTLLRKIREIFGVLVMEKILSKNEIMEWYINLVEFGDGVYGVKQAAKNYFQTEPGLLTIAQSIHLALVLPSPNRWSLGLRQGSLTNFGKKRFLDILDEMFLTGVVTKHQYLATSSTGNFGQPIGPTQNEVVIKKLSFP